MSETTFENAKVGDRVWSVEFGWGRVDSVHPYKEVIFQNNQMYRFNSDGSRFFTLKVNQTLFWDEIRIVPPERPKRKVVKTMNLWAVIEGHVYHTFKSFESAQAGSGLTKPIVHLTGTYEVEE